jgi:hypothetical protein
VWRVSGTVSTLVCHKHNKNLIKNIWAVQRIKKEKIVEEGKHSRAGCKRARPPCELTAGLIVPSKMCDLEKKEVQTLWGSVCGHSNRRRLRQYGGGCVRCSEEKWTRNRRDKDKDKNLTRCSMLRLCLVMRLSRRQPSLQSSLRS